MTFGPFRFAPRERLLTRNGVSVELGARATDILAALVARPNEIVSKGELLAQVWPDAVVEEGSVRFHVSNLRKALGDGRDGARYIATIGGRGYCLVAPLTPATPDRDSRGRADARVPDTDLPARPERLIGRAGEVETLVERLPATRLVTLLGHGGMGKTALAVAVGHDLAASFEGMVLFVDLGTLADPGLVAPTLASLLGLSVASDDPVPPILAHLRGRRMLIILDTCEHLVEGAASLASALISTTTGIHVLATSREALRVPGEQVFPIAPLALPADDEIVGAAYARCHPAIRLFLEHAEAAGGSITLDDETAATVATICRRLDGVPLAIELAAGRVAAHGIAQIARLLDEHFALLWPGHRTAPPRQRTLQATLDWSCRLLGDAERRILRQLAVFVGHLTLDDAIAVLTGPELERTSLLTALDDLVAKSIVAARPVNGRMRYRLLDTTRAYLLHLPLSPSEAADLGTRHSLHYRAWLVEEGTRWPTLSDAAERAFHRAGLDNARAALEWAFGPEGDARLGVGLAVAAGPVFLSMSLLPECRRWSERALRELGSPERGDRDEMRLQAALGISLMFMHGGHDDALAALTRSLDLAERHADRDIQSSLLGPLNMFHLRAGDFTEALRCAERSRRTLELTADPAGRAVAHCILGTSLHLTGDVERARSELEQVRRPEASERTGWTTAPHLGFEAWSLAGAILARCLWLQGLEAEALQHAAEVVRETERIDHPLSHCIVLIWAATVFLWAGDLDGASRVVEELAACAEANSLGPYRLVARGFAGELACRRGDFAVGTLALRDAIAALHAAPYELLTTHLEIALARGLDASGQSSCALDHVEETIHAVERRGDRCYLPELCDLRSRLTLSIARDAHDGARSG